MLCLKPIIEFQFHNGSIKSKKSKVSVKTYHKFQFHNGSIKRTTNPHLAQAIELFQFHNGSIKSEWNYDAIASPEKVSIPQWFD